MDMEILREEIDQIDYELVQLLNRRAVVAQQIGSIKSQLQWHIFDAEREQLVMANACAYNKGPLTDADVQAIFTQIVLACRRIQEERGEALA